MNNLEQKYGQCKQQFQDLEALLKADLLLTSKRPLVESVALTVLPPLNAGLQEAENKLSSFAKQSPASHPQAGNSSAIILPPALASLEADDDKLMWLWLKITEQLRRLTDWAKWFGLFEELGEIEPQVSRKVEPEAALKRLILTGEILVPLTDKLLGGDTKKKQPESETIKNYISDIDDILQSLWCRTD